MRGDFDQVPLPFELVEDAIKYLRENDEATIKFYKGNAFIVEAPNFVNLKVVETEPGVKGDTATNDESGYRRDRRCDSGPYLYRRR